MLIKQSQEVLPIPVLPQRLYQARELIPVDVSKGVSDLLNACYLQALPLFDGGDELARFEETLVGSSVEPGISSSEELDPQGSPSEILFVHIGDLDLSPPGRLHILSDLHDIVIVEIE